MDNWNDLKGVINIIKNEKKENKKRKYKKCIYCLKDISKTNFSKHLLRRHFKHITSYKKKIKIVSKSFIDNTNKIINNLEEIQSLLSESIKIKIKKSKNLLKRKWFIEYQDNINELIILLKGKGNQNDDEEESDDDMDENDEQ